MLFDGGKFAGYVGKCTVETSIGLIESVASTVEHPFAETGADTVDGASILEDFPGVTVTFANHCNI